MRETLGAFNYINSSRKEYLIRLGNKIQWILLMYIACHIQY